MTEPVRIWLAATHHAAFLNGGWAFVRAEGTFINGVAGGDRRTTRDTMALNALFAALKDLPDAAPLVIQAQAPDAVTLTEFFSTPKDPTTEDLELRARIRKALAGRQARLVRFERTPGTPMVFASAWADQGADKAKTKGSFHFVIPRPNLAKVPGL
jgi:hypothetical protein